MAAVTVAVLVALVACIVALALRAMKGYRSSVPGPPALPFIGHALEFVNMDLDKLFHTLLKLVEGRHLCQLSLLTRTVIVISDPTCFGELVRRKDLNDKSVFAYSLLHVVAKRGLIQLGGPEWKEHRVWLAPGFKKSVLDTFVTDFNAVAKDFLKTVPTEQDVDVRKLIGRPMTRAFILTSLGDDWDEDDEIHSITDFIDEFFRTVMLRSFNPLLWSDSLFMLTADGRNMLKMKEVVDSFTKKFIIRKRAALRTKKSEEAEPIRKTLMDIMIDTPEHQEPMSEEAIQDEVKTSYAASVETTATALCWALKILSLMPEVQQRLCDELYQVFGDSDRDVCSEDMPQLKYMERFFKEVLRMYPPVPFIARQCYNNTEIWGHQVAAGTTLAINIFSIHRDPRYWKDPGIFDPDRFLPDIAKDRHPYAYIPFSAGSRNCIGGTYAMQLMVTFLATALRTYSVHPVDDHHKSAQTLTDDMTYNITSGLRGGVRVKFLSRVAGLRPQAQPATACS
ncbi:cytochrome P450 4C1-like [Thrips palmi]|uniref:Cytochrome P450 4C1-like n=1 Tax=Thrips palmi TaxID=161013 RepID=A0A6P8ZDD4_THRPL|nr:cytochrome P450 4C1-like [Thrips palmi]